MIHARIRYISRRIYSYLIVPVPFLRRLWWDIKEYFLNRFIRGNTIKVELSASCNARCSFCWMFQAEQKPNGIMPLEHFRKFIDINKEDFIRSRTRIQPFFNGEALTHPHFFEIIDYIVENGIRLARLDTNLAVRKDMKRLMSYPWPVICVNAGGVTKEVHEKVMKTKFEVLVENLEQVFAINKNRVFLKVTPVKYNVGQLKLFPNFIKQLGGNPKRLEIGTTGFNNPAIAKDKEVVQFFDEVVSPEVDHYLRFTYDLTKPRYAIKAKRPGCHFLQDCVTYDGKLTICCQDQFGTLNVGDAFNTPFSVLKRATNYHRHRQMGINQQFKMCEECN